MILMMSFIGWKVWGFPGALASAFATFGPPCTIYFASYRLWDRFRDAPWQRIVRLGLVPVVMGLVIASGMVMARAANTGWPAAAVTIAATAITLATRLNPMWTLLWVALSAALASFDGILSLLSVQLTFGAVSRSRRSR